MIRLQVLATNIDAILSCREVTFIKMDIEEARKHDRKCLTKNFADLARR